MSADKKFTWKQIFKHLWPYIQPYTKTIVLVLALTGLSIVVDLAEPVIYKRVMNDLTGVFVHKASEPSIDAPESIIDEYLQKTQIPHKKGYVAPRTVDQGLRALVLAAVLLFLVNILSQAFSLLADFYSSRYSSYLEQDFIEALYAHVLKMKLPFLNKRPSTALAKQIDQTDEVGPAVTSIIQEISAQIIRILGAIAIMLSQSINLSLISLAIIPVYFILAKRMANRIEASSEDYYVGWDDVSTQLQSSLANIKTVKVSGAEQRVAHDFKQSLRKVNNAFLDRNKAESWYIFGQSVIIQLGKLIVLCFGSWKVIEHQLTPGDVVMFVSLLDKLFDPIDALSSHSVSLQTQKVSISRGLRLLHSRSIEPQGKALINTLGHVRFDNVFFGYRRDHSVIKGISFDLQPGKITALVGRSGSGKTTISDLMLKFYEPEKGQIFFDEIDIAKADPSSVRQSVGVVLAEGAIFEGTLKDNICFRDSNVSDARVEEAVLGAGLAHTIARLPHGLNTKVGENGIGLSVGEKQRVQIARILASQPKILILDEATANLDYSTESEIRKHLLALRDRCTILTIAHRPTMVQDVDHVIVLENGRITAQGSVDETRKKSEWFDNMMKQSVNDTVILEDGNELPIH